MSESQKLIDLAERCEAAIGLDRGLNALIDVALRIGLPTMPKWVWRNFPNNWRARPDHRVEVFNSDGVGGIHWDPQKFTGSFDAALRLTPDGAGLNIQGAGDCWYAVVAGANSAKCKAASLALTAAALRARAAIA